ncbi:MAG TPA: MFS transporter [Flavisolibacter sp.]|nr:MFS transporter [Flavisolibacter sp.]
MKFKTSEHLTNQQVQSGLKLVIGDGLTAEAMVTLTGGTFLMAMAVGMGASNFQIGLLASLPTFTNIFQLISIWLVQKYNNRRAVMVISSFFARTPLFIIGLLPFLFSTGTSVQVLIFLLSFHYFFGSIAGASWNSWMKDLVPENILGTYFSRRSRLTQTLNVVLSLVLALSLDYIKKYYPQMELTAYSIMFVVGALIGMLGVYFLSRTPEPRSYLAKENLFKLFGKPLKDKNFRQLLAFNSFWAFALNIATPFFSVYMMKSLNLPLSTIIGLGLLAQVSSIFSIQMWGRYSDQYSNKTIMSIAAPIYIACILAWTFTAMGSTSMIVLGLLAIINVFTGISTAGINLTLNNICLKLSPKDESIVYISARNIIVAFVSAVGPMVGGWLADFFSKRNLQWNINWEGPKGSAVVSLIDLHNWNFLFLIGGLLAMISLYLLRNVNEEGEVEKGIVIGKMRVAFQQKLIERTRKEALLSYFAFPVTYPIALTNKVKSRIENRVVRMRRLQSINEIRKRAA